MAILRETLAKYRGITIYQEEELKLAREWCFRLSKERSLTNSRLRYANREKRLKDHFYAVFRKLLKKKGYGVEVFESQVANRRRGEKSSYVGGPAQELEDSVNCGKRTGESINNPEMPRKKKKRSNSQQAEIRTRVDMPPKAACGGIKRKVNLPGLVSKVKRRLEEDNPSVD